MDWDNYFMGVAETVALKSKDKRTKVGCVLVNNAKHIIATGFNGAPPGYPDENIEWFNSSSKELVVVHAEANALLHAETSTKDAICYVTLHPCAECTKLLITAGIRKVYYRTYRDFPHARHLLEACRIEAIHLPGGQKCQE